MITGRAARQELLSRAPDMSRHWTSYLDPGKDRDGELNRSWDVGSRFRLQEEGLKVVGSSRDELFRVQVKLGLHEITAALSSIR